MHYFLTFLLVSASSIAFATEGDSIKIPKVEAQNFDQVLHKIINESESYKDLKLIKNSDLDIIATAHTTDIDTYKSTIVSLQEEINKKNESQLEQKQNASNYDEVPTENSNASTTTLFVFIGLAVLLLLIIIVAIIQNKKLKETINSHKSSLDSIENEFDEFKRSAMERELKVKRELLNERNKNLQ